MEPQTFLVELTSITMNAVSAEELAKKMRAARYVVFESFPLYPLERIGGKPESFSCEFRIVVGHPHIVHLQNSDIEHALEGSSYLNLEVTRV